MLRAFLFWSIIAAAFIGPGTVTTAAKAGSAHGLLLLWALLFSVVATWVLQEAAARLALGSGQPLGVLLGTGAKGRGVGAFLFFAVSVGCGAYQAGNLLGAFAGMQLLGLTHRAWLLLPVALATALLWTGNTPLITRSLAATVGLMGLVFCGAAWAADTQAQDWLVGLAPRLTDDTSLLVIGLIGTTIVPYNLFLASGLRHGQTLRDMRRGLAIAIALGGIITLAIMLAGTMVSGEFSFAGLAQVLDARFPGYGRALLGWGLFAAGFSSAITAPLAAAVAGQSLVGHLRPTWESQGIAFRLTWGTILAVGTVFALADTKPIPVIIAAQALNGVILPFVAIFLLLAVNDRSRLAPPCLNGMGRNLVTLMIVGTTIGLGLHNMGLALAEVVPAWKAIAMATRLQAIGLLVAVVVAGLAIRIWFFDN